MLEKAIMALESSGAVSFTDFQQILDSITGQISVTTVVGVISAVVGAGIGFVFMWWGVRKLASSLMAAFRSGKLKF